MITDLLILKNLEIKNIDKFIRTITITQLYHKSYTLKIIAINIFLV